MVVDPDDPDFYDYFAAFDATEAGKELEVRRLDLERRYADIQRRVMEAIDRGDDEPTALLQEMRSAMEENRALISERARLARQ